MPTIDFHAQHSPAGAQAQFTIGKFSARGGLGIGVAGIPQQDVFVGWSRGGVTRCLPFYADALSRQAEAFTQTQSAGGPKLQPYAGKEIRRAYSIASDVWTTDVLKLEVFTPLVSVPDPDAASFDDLARAIRPSVSVRLTVDNSKSREAMRAFFALGNFPRYMSLRGADLVGVSSAGECGFATCRRSDIAVRPFCEWSLQTMLERPEPRECWLAGTAGICADIPPGRTAAIDIAVGFYHAGRATLGRDTVYMYTRHFGSLEDVLLADLADRERTLADCRSADARLRKARLNDEQRFLIAHAVHSYFGNTQLLAEGRRPVWVVNEGSFMMMNTFDLTVDHLFFEMKLNTWTVRNELDSFYERYSYHDTVHFPDSPGVQHPGGISFTHDMGVNNVFTPDGHSSYEAKDQPGCFSHMTHEELVNWVLCGADYWHGTGDGDWLTRRAGVFRECLASMQNRDHPDPARRDGVMSLDSSRCGREAEITTYDSLDASLGQARDNLYLAVKCWAAYLALETVLAEMGYADEAKSARRSAELAARTVAAAYDRDLGYIPAILNSDSRSAIIPAVEGLIFPHRLGLLDALRKKQPHKKLIDTLRLHLGNILKPGFCLFKDSSWKMSSTSINSWPSKVFLCQHIAREILGFDFGEEQLKHDRAHAAWWRIGSAPYGVIDQFFEGKTSGGGCIYPRGVTNVLWLDE